MKKEDVFNSLENGLIVSCQALPDEPLYQEDGGVMKLMAKAAIEAGAVGIRAQGIVDIKEIRSMTTVPLIGIIKINRKGFKQYITPTMKEVDELVKLNCDIIAVDGTNQKRGDGISPIEYIKSIKEKYPELILMADISTVDEALEAIKAGADCVGTTMSGYTDYTDQGQAPDLQLIKAIKEKTDIPIIAEGRYHYPEQAKKALELGAFCVTIGGAITRPQEITKRFVEAIK